MNPPADNTNTFPGSPSRSFDPSAVSAAPTASAESVGQVATTSTVSAGRTPTPTPTPFVLDLPGHTCLRFLNKGGMGEVWLYHEHRHNREVAVKLFSVREETPAKAIDRFVREYETLRNLDHTKVVQVYQVGRVSGFVYYSMRYVPTGTLVRQEKAVRASARTAAEFTRKLAAAVEYVHRRNVLHRDIKPGNILVDEAGDPLLADFGLAWVDDGHTTTLGNAPFGTPAYMAPEVTRHGPGACTERSDVWAVGVILYELLAGVRPFTADKDDPAVLYRSIRHDRPPPVRDSADALPDADERLETICLKCLAKSPAHRYQSAGELAADLQSWLDGRPLASPAQPYAPDVRSAAELPPDPADVAPTVTAPGPPPKRWQPKMATAALLTVLLTAAVLSATLWPKPPVKKTLAERLLKPGDSVTFIGKTGLPLEEVDPLVGFETAGSLQKGAGGHSTLTAVHQYFLQVFNEPLAFPVRWEVEVALGTRANPTRAGLYAIEQSHTRPNGTQFHLGYVNDFGHGDRDEANKLTLQNHFVAVAPAKFSAFDGTPASDVQTMFVPLATRYPIKVTPPDAYDPFDQQLFFHHLAIVVRPDRVFGTRDGNNHPPFVFKTDAWMVERPLAVAERVVFNRPTFGHGFGIYVRNGDATFRNLKITRLDE